MTQIMVAAGSAAAIHGVPEAWDGSSPECQDSREEPTVMLPRTGESTVALDTPSPTPVWPWPGIGQFSSPYYTPYDAQSFRASNSS